MARGILFPAEIEQLKANPNVLFVDENRIVYTNQFKHHFMNEYLTGKGPTQIFRDAGFEPKMLGSKRIECATARWKESYKAGTLGLYPDMIVRHKNAVKVAEKYSKDFTQIEREFQKQLLEKQNKIDELEAQIEQLKQLIT